MFPYAATSSRARGVDLDHVVPYLPLEHGDQYAHDLAQEIAWDRLDEDELDSA